MTATLADPLTAMRITETPDRISAVDENGVEVAGAFKPVGHDGWRVYATARLTEHTHNVIAVNQQIARWHVEMLAELFERGQL